jgi:WhiB family redox-sensing transcriptional regulator
MGLRDYISIPSFLEKDDPLCAQTDPELFFSQPVAGSEDLFKTKRSVYLSERQAKEICKECPLIKDCLAYALKYDEHGIWGGTTEQDREKIRRSLGIRVLRRYSDQYV